MKSLRTHQPIRSLCVTACALALHTTSTNRKAASPQSTIREAEIKSHASYTSSEHSGFLNLAARSGATMSAFSPWNTGPPSYMPPGYTQQSGSSRTFTNTGGTAPPWTNAPPNYPPLFDEPRRPSHFYTYPDPEYYTHVDRARSTTGADSDLNEPQVRPRHAYVYDGNLEADVETGKTRAIRPVDTTSASTSRRYSSTRSAVLSETISTVTRSTANSGSRITYATAVSHMSSRLTYATASSRISRNRSNFASQSSSTISYYTAPSSTSHRPPSSATADSDQSINNL